MGMKTERLYVSTQIDEFGRMDIEFLIVPSRTRVVGSFIVNVPCYSVSCDKEQINFVIGKRSFQKLVRGLKESSGNKNF